MVSCLIIIVILICRLAFSLEHGNHGHSHNHNHDHSIIEIDSVNCAKTAHAHEDLNLRAALIHVIGDLVQSVGVLIASGIIWYKEEWRIADPICTLLFSVIVMVSTLFISRDILRILMEGKRRIFLCLSMILGAPKNMNINNIYKDLHGIEGVERAHDLHVWAISPGNTALTVHVSIKPEFCQQDILSKVQEKLCTKYTIHHSTIQVEKNESLHCNPASCSKI